MTALGIMIGVATTVAVVWPSLLTGAILVAAGTTVSWVVR